MTQQQDPVVEAFWRGARAHRKANRHVRAKESKLAKAAMDEAMAADADFKRALPSTWRGALLKGRAAILSLQATNDYAAADIVRTFFRSPRPVDDEWISDLRVLISRVEFNAQEPQKAVACLRDILKGLSGPRPL